MGISVSGADCRCKASRSPDLNKESDQTDVLVDISDSLFDGPGSVKEQFRIAVETGEIEQVRSLLRRKADVDCILDESGNVALHLAASNGHIQIAQALLDNSADAEAKTRLKKSALLLAADGKHVNLAKVLIERGCKKSCLSKRLREAAMGGDVVSATWLLKCGADIVERDREGRMPLHLSTSKGHLEICRLLVDNRAKVEAKSKDGSSPISFAVKRADMDIVKCLETAGAFLKSNDLAVLRQRLMDAIQEGDLDSVKKLKRFAPTFEDDLRGRVPAVLALEVGRVDIFSALSEEGLSQVDRAALGKAFRDACEKGNMEHVMTLLKCSVDINCKDCFSETPLWKASYRGHAEVVKVLLERGCSIEDKSLNDCRTPVLIAIDRGRSACVALLVKGKAELPGVSLLSRKLRDASRLGELARATTLCECRADVNDPGEEKEAPLIKAALHSGGENEAARMQRVHVADLLIKSAADVNSKGGIPCRSALQHAEIAGGAEMVQMLLQNGASRSTWKSGSDRRWHYGVRSLTQKRNKE